MSRMPKSNEEVEGKLPKSDKPKPAEEELGVLLAHIVKKYPKSWLWMIGGALIGFGPNVNFFGVVGTFVALLAIGHYVVSLDWN